MKPLKQKHLYEFGPFRLFGEESILKRDDVPVPVTPKVCELLVVLLENRGKTLDKEFLLGAVWPDSFVEEGNISFNIRQLRKALGDNVHDPIYIETVPRRGYRFFADVKRIAVETDEPTPDQFGVETKSSNIRSGHALSGLRYFYLVPFVVLGVITSIWAWFLLSEKAAAAPILASPFAAEKLSTTGSVYGAAISPDGQTLVYSKRANGKQSVRLRQLDAGTNVELIPAADELYYELIFSPDGKWIYFTRAIRDDYRKIDTFRISIFGGIPQKVVSGTEGSVSLSPDGEKLSFVRCPIQNDEWCSLWLADAADGANERKLVMRPFPIRIADNEISPDGKRIAFAVGHSRNQANEFTVSAVAIDSGEETPITAEKFFNIKNIGWIPDSSGLLLTAARMPNKYFRIWHLDLGTGAADPLTKDSEAYSVLSLDRNASKLVTTQIKQDFRIHLFNVDDPADKRYLADASRATFAPDGTVIFTSVMSGNDEIWRINADGSGQRQLTNDPGGDGHPIVSHDSKTIFFTSNRSGSAHIWKMARDGSGQTQVTRSEGGSPAYATSDGKTLFYRHAISGTLWSVSLESGEEKPFLEHVKRQFAFSPDGSKLAFEESNGTGPSVTIISPTTGDLVKKIALPKEKSRLLEIAWMPDGHSLMFLMSDADFEKNTVFIQDLDSDTARKISDLGDDEVSEVSGIAVSPDGKHFTVVQGGWKHDAVLFRGLK